MRKKEKRNCLYRLFGIVVGISIFEEINEVLSHWKKFADEVNVLPELCDAISKTLLNLK